MNKILNPIHPEGKQPTENRMDVTAAKRKKRTGGSDSAPDVPEMARGPQGQKPKAAAARREYQRRLPKNLPDSYESNQADDEYMPG